MKICELKPSSKVRSRWLATLEDGSLLRVTEREMVDFSLYAGMELDEAQARSLLAAVEESEARNKALSLASARPYACKELERRLQRSGISPENAGRAVGWLTEIGLLNDEQYARLLVQRFSEKGWGEYRIRQELTARGVPRQFWEQAMDDLDDPSAAIDAFVAKKLAGTKPDRQQWKKISDALARRGYSWDDISQALNRAGAGLE